MMHHPHMIAQPNASAAHTTENVVRFVDALRHYGLKPGLAEVLDAMTMLETLGLEDRGAVKAALGALFAKSEVEMARYHYAFDRFFVGLDQQRQVYEQETEAQVVHKKLIAQSADELRFQGERLDLPETLIEVYAHMPESEKEKLRDFLEQTSTGKNVGPKFKPVTEQLVKGKLRRQSAGNGSGQGAGSGIPGEDGLLYKSISAISPDEVPQALRLIRMLVRRINARISRDYKRSARRGQLDMKASIHKSLSTGGSLYKLKFRRKRRRKQRTIILCDVSASMLLFSGFGTQFIHGMNAIADKSEVYLFSEGIERIAESDLSSLAAFESGVAHSALWGRGTNLNTALAALQRGRDVNLHGAVLLIFSDAKTMQAQAAGQRLAELRRVCRRILWMNPLPEQDWNLLPWIAAYRKQCSMLDCSTLERLGLACAHSARVVQ